MGDDSAVLDWRPAARTVLSAWESELLAESWELVPTDGTEPLRSASWGDPTHRSSAAQQRPLALPDGSVFGVLRLFIDGHLDPQPDAKRTAQFSAMAATLESLLHAHDAAQKARGRAQAAEAASRTDVLTGLPNQRAWRDALAVEQARASRSKAVALMAVVDLDDLKMVNDAEGHLAGDVLLRVAAQTLRAAVRIEDVVARTGGDEFCVMAVDYKPPDADVLAFRLRSALADASIAASIGAVVRDPSESLAEAAHRADRLMYADKQSRKSTNR